MASQVEVLGGSKEQVQEEKTRFDKEIDAILQQKQQPHPGERKLRKTKSNDDNRK